jgi:hypothetical protein
MNTYKHCLAQTKHERNVSYYLSYLLKISQERQPQLPEYSFFHSAPVLFVSDKPTGMSQLKLIQFS